jgi:hypothetical protein
MIKITIGCHRQRPRDRRCCHHDHINPFAFLAKQNALAHTKTMLFIDNGKPKIGKMYIV